MNDLQSAIRELRRELEAALSPGVDGERRMLIPESVTASIGVALAIEGQSPNGGKSEGAQSVWRIAAPGTQSQHTLTFTFGVESRGPSGASRSLKVNSETPISVKDASQTRERDLEGLTERCGQIFGKPGFDNSTRAEVFCEIAALLDPAQLAKSVEHAGSTLKIQEHDPLHREIHRIRQLLSFAPVGAKRASELLLALFNEAGPAQVRDLLLERWRFGTHWELPTPGSEKKDTRNGSKL